MNDIGYAEKSKERVPFWRVKEIMRGLRIRRGKAPVVESFLFHCRDDADVENTIEQLKCNSDYFIQ
jgi:hypothetical protein